MNCADDANTKDQDINARLRIGEPFDAYIIESLLGRGGMGEVYKVRHQTLDSEYAIKVLPPSFAKRQDALQRFQNEARVMSRLDHPNIVRVDDFRMTDGLYWLRMELARGDDSGAVNLQELADRNNGTLNQDLLFHLMQDVLKGVAYAHENGVIHRDLKPANVLLFPDSTGELNAKVSDYGLVKLLGEEFQRSQVTSIISVSNTESCEGTEEDTFNRALIGTWEYMSPEQQETGDVQKTSDVYSLGLMIYRLLTGRKLSPWPPSHYVKNLDSEIDVFVLRALEPEPQDRFLDAGHMLEALNEIIIGIDDAELPFELPPELGEASSDDSAGSFRSETQDTPHMVPIVEVQGDSSGGETGSEHQVETDLQRVRDLVDTGKEEEALMVLSALIEVLPDHPALLREQQNIQRKKHQKQLDELQATTLNKNSRSGRSGLIWIVFIFALFCGVIFWSFWGVDDSPVTKIMDLIQGESVSTQTPVPPRQPTISLQQLLNDSPGITSIQDPVSPIPSISPMPSYSPSPSPSPIPTSTQTPAPEPTKPTTVSSDPAIKPTALRNDNEDLTVTEINTPAVNTQDPFAPYVTRIPDLALEFIRLKPGSFLMGSDSEGSYEKPMHYVKVSNDFLIARTEVTLADYRFYMKETGNTDGINWADNNCPFRYLDGFPITGFKFGQVDTQPVVKISWFGAMEFCAWLTARERKAGRLRQGYEYRLPTEAEWEYAARAGSSTRYHWGDDWDCGMAMAENDPKSSEGACVRYYKSHRIPVKATAPVRSFKPNMWGVFDMNGNVWEWCLDWFEPQYYSQSPSSDPSGPQNGAERVIRGGSWLNAAEKCSSSYRGSSPPGTYHSTVGFRPVLSNSR